VDTGPSPAPGAVGLIGRGGIAILSAMFSRAFIQDARQARKNGTYPTVDDPARVIR
jgi:hypothetical protein